MTNTQKLEALDKLIDAVESGDLTRKQHLGMPMVTACYTRDARGQIIEDGWSDAAVMDAYNGSLTSALSLHNALLPGWAWAIGTCNVSDDARVFPLDDSRAPDGGEWSQYTDIDQRPPGNPARAWLASILIAYRAKVAE